MTGGQVEVDTTATALNAAETGVQQRAGQTVALWSDTALALGGDDVTWADGAQLPANVIFSVELDRDEVLYAAVETGTATVHVVTQGG